MTKVPYVDIASQHAPLKDELLAAVRKVLEHGQFVLGPELELFEERFAQLCDVPYAVGVASGTDALVLALRALDVGCGDEVITVPNSFIATASAIVAVGARPVFVDVGCDYNIDPSEVEQAITARTRAILPVHLTGRPANMDRIIATAARHDLYVVEDAAQAVIAKYMGRPVGSIGDMGCFSLHPLKTLSACGEAGVITTRDQDMSRKLRVLRNIGLETRDSAILWSGNHRMDTMQAAMLLVKMDHLEEWTMKRRDNAEFYRQHLSGIMGFHTPAPTEHEWCVYHTYIVEAERRDELKHYLKERGVETAIHYSCPIHLQPAAKEYGNTKGCFPVAETQAKRILSLPIHQGLTQEQLAIVVDAIQSFYGG